MFVGELSMQKVKVHRYVSGKRPDYAQDVRSDSESDEDDFLERRNHPHHRSPSPEVTKDDDLNDPRLRRLKIREVDTEIRPERRRHIVEPEILETSDEDEKQEHVNLPGIEISICCNTFCLDNIFRNNYYYRAKAYLGSP